MPKTYRKADPEVYELAQELIEEYEPHLSGWTLVIVFETNEDKQGFPVDPKPNKHGKVKLGNAKCYGQRERAAGCPAFLVTLLWNYWDKADDFHRRALLHHELCHCAISETETADDVTEEPATNPHDLEEFNKIAQLYGEWDAAVETFAGQLRFHYDGAAERKGAEGLQLLDKLLDARDEAAEGERYDPETGELLEAGQTLRRAVAGTGATLTLSAPGITDQVAVIHG